MVTLSHCKTGARIVGWLTVACALMASSCGIFSPRDSELPEISSQTDPLQFSQIMEKSGPDSSGTLEQFTKLRYEDLFLDDLYYEDINTGRYTKNQVIQRLRQIQVQYPAIKVGWGGGEWWKRTDTIIVSGVRYTVDPAGDGSALETGSSNFIVIKNWEWHIAEWRDVPDKPGKSFFSP